MLVSCCVLLGAVAVRVLQRFRGGMSECAWRLALVF